MASPSPVSAFDRAVRDDWSRRGWDPSGAALLLCVSGGADSMALLHCFRRLAPRLRLRLAAVHVDHRLRPDSAGDAAFVAAACAEAGIPLHAFVLDPERRAAGESIEMWARRERYDRFQSAAAAAGADWILTAHHRDDQVETVFQRLGRGTGPRGLAGIPFRRGNIARPFLDRPREEIRAGLAAESAPWREDLSNADVTFERNWYRHRFLPALRSREPDLDARVARMADLLRGLEPWIQALDAGPGMLRFGADGAPRLEAVLPDAGGAAADRDLLREGVAALLRAEAAANGRTDAARVTSEILDELLRQSARGGGRVRVQVAPGLALVGENRAISCARTYFPSGNGPIGGKKGCSPEAQRVILDGGSARAVWRWGGRTYSLTARRFPRPAGLRFPDPSEERAIFDANRISCTLLVRIRKDGDRFSPLGVSSRSRKLKKFFNEEKVPAELRDSLPIVVSCHPSRGAGTPADGEPDGSSGSPGSPAGDAEPLEGEIPAWVPGHGISDFYKVRGSTTDILELVMKCENP